MMRLYYPLIRLIWSVRKRDYTTTTTSFGNCRNLVRCKMVENMQSRFKKNKTFGRSYA